MRDVAIVRVIRDNMIRNRELEKLKTQVKGQNSVIVNQHKRIKELEEWVEILISQEVGSELS